MVHSLDELTGPSRVGRNQLVGVLAVLECALLIARVLPAGPMNDDNPPGHAAAMEPCQDHGLKYTDRARIESGHRADPNTHP